MGASDEVLAYVRITSRLQAYSTPQLLAAVAPAVFVLLWSTGFVGARWALPYAEPFTFLALRLGLATLLMVGLTRAMHGTWPGPRDAVQIAICGVLLHATYLGGVFWAISRGMPAGMAALIVGLQPVLTAVIAPLVLSEVVVGRQWSGLALGFGGVGLVVGEQVLAANLRAIPPHRILLGHDRARGRYARHTVPTAVEYEDAARKWYSNPICCVNCDPTGGCYAR